MKLLESYANNSSVDIEFEPNLPIQYFPVPSDKYITIQNSSGMPSKDFDLWNEVLLLILPYLESAGIKIVQIGQGEVKPLNNVISLVNKTSFAQSVYVLKNAILHCGNDSWAAHGCAKDVPCVVLYGSTSINAHSPYFYHPESIFLESHRWNKNCSFNPGENPKTINLIPPEQVAAGILEILKIPHDISQKSLYAGGSFLAGNTEVHLVPDAVLNPESVNAPQIHLRADLFFDLNLLVENLRRKKYILWLDREIDLNVLKQLKPNIENLIFWVDDDTNPEFLTKIQKLGIPLFLLTKLSPEDHNKIKLDFVELPIVNRVENVLVENVKNSIKKYKNLENSSKFSDFYFEELDFFYKSKKLYLSGGKIFLSLTDWKKNISVENTESESRADFQDQEFLNEIESFYVFEK